MSGSTILSESASSSRSKALEPIETRTRAALTVSETHAGANPHEAQLDRKLHDVREGL